MEASPRLTGLLKEHDRRLEDIRRYKDDCRRSAAQASHQFTDDLLTAVNAEVSRSFAQQKRVEDVVRALHEETARFQKQTQRWVQLIHEFNSSLKELGDVENWAAAMERDMVAVTATLEFVHGQAAANANANASPAPSLPAQRTLKQ